MTASPGSYVYENDKLGNRTWRNRYTNTSSSQRYTWDEAGRMFSFCTPSAGAKYIYRADGMRVEKVEGLSLNWIPPTSEEEDSESSGYYDSIWATNKPTTRYYYDGQMCMEDDYTAPSTFTKRKYGIGARGIDFIENWSNSTTIASTKFPIYDCHGNMIATIVRPSSGSATLADTRYFDAWGSPSNSGGPKQKYCASLGHAQDDESGLIYMRARYYEPGSGRFISQDPYFQGFNWYVYSPNNPITYVDSSGKSWEELFELVAHLFEAGHGGFGVGQNARIVWDHPSASNVGKFFLALYLDMLESGTISLCVAALISAVCVPGVGLVTIVICSALALALLYVGYLAEEGTNEALLPRSEP